MTNALPGVDPMPPAVRGWPVVGAGPALLRQGADFFAAQRARLGDTFLVDAFRYRLFCVLSPAGVRALYALPEREASFGLATYELVMRHKLPLELVAGRRTRPHDLFGSQEVEGYLAHLEEAVARQLDGARRLPGVSSLRTSRAASVTGSGSRAGRARRLRRGRTSTG